MFAEVGIAKRQLDKLFLSHAGLALVGGLLCFLLPHSVAASMLSFGHWAHELIRIYGALTLSMGWLVWNTRKIADLLLRKTLAQAFSLGYTLQFIALLRAQLTSPDDHSILGWLAILVFGGLGATYGYFLLFTPLKTFATYDVLDKAEQ